MRWSTLIFFAASKRIALSKVPSTAGRTCYCQLFDIKRLKRICYGNRRSWGTSQLCRPSPGRARRKDCSVVSFVQQLRWLHRLPFHWILQCSFLISSFFGSRTTSAPIWEAISLLAALVSVTIIRAAPRSCVSCSRSNPIALLREW